jgi:adenine phosphoribosyltransferase
MRIASFNILGDRELVAYAARQLCRRLRPFTFDYLIGPEITVLPLIHEMAALLAMPRYVVLRKKVHGYMVDPLQVDQKNGLVINGPDAELIKNKSVVVVDDIVSTGKTIQQIQKLLASVNVQVVAQVTILKQGDQITDSLPNLIYLEKIPLFPVTATKA